MQTNNIMKMRRECAIKWTIHYEFIQEIKLYGLKPANEMPAMWMSTKHSEKLVSESKRNQRKLFIECIYLILPLLEWDCCKVL